MKQKLSVTTFFFIVGAFLWVCTSSAIPPMPSSSGTGLTAANAVAITGGNITGITNLQAVSANITGITVANVLTVGTTSAGGNVTVNATLGNELSPAYSGNSGVNWTLGAGWETPISGGVLNKNAAGTGTATPTAASGIVAGKTYKVVITSSLTAGYATYTIGGVRGTTILTSTPSITEYVTANTTGNVIITPIDTTRGTITISWKLLSNGETTIDGTLYTHSPILSYGLNTQNAALPQYSFYGDTNTGLSHRYADNLGLVVGGSEVLNLTTSGVALTGYMSWQSSVLASSDAYLYRDAADTLALRRTTFQQALRIYNTYTDAGNYERVAITGVQGSSINIKSETSGTGADNIDIILTPSGTGGVGVRPSTETTGGGYVTKIARAIATMSGATSNIDVNVPVGATILNCQLRVNTAITSDNATKTWAAVYAGGAAAQAITTGQVFDKNTKVNKAFDANANSPLVTSSVGTITISAAAGNFTGGVVEAFVYYTDNITLADSP